MQFFDDKQQFLYNIFHNIDIKHSICKCYIYHKKNQINIKFIHKQFSNYLNFYILIQIIFVLIKIYIKIKRNIYKYIIIYLFIYIHINIYRNNH